MLYEIGGHRVAVEFDGDEHYRHTLKIKADIEKDEAASERLQGCTVPLLGSTHDRDSVSLLRA